MRCMIGLLVVVCMAAMLAGCSGLGTIGGMGSTSGAPPQAGTLGPDTATTEAATDTTAARLDSGVAWLWASVSGLRDKLAALASVAPHAAEVADQALDKARQVVADVEAAAKAGKLGNALTLWTKARSAIGEVADAVQALAVTSAAGV